MEWGGGRGLERALPFPLRCASSQRPGCGGGSGVFGLLPWAAGGARRRRRQGYIHRAVLAGTAGASLAVLRGWGSLSVLLLLLLHLLYDFPDLALCSLGGRGEARAGGQGRRRERLRPPPASHRASPSELLSTGRARGSAQPQLRMC